MDSFKMRMMESQRKIDEKKLCGHQNILKVKNSLSTPLNLDFVKIADLNSSNKKMKLTRWCAIRINLVQTRAA